MSRPIDWNALAALRQRFLERDFSAEGYWSSPALLEDYDQTFAARIGWKWDAVLEELKRRGWRPPIGRVVDWGCGTGIAARKLVEHFGEGEIEALTFWDAVPASMQFAEQQLKRAHPSLEVRRARQAPYREPGLLLLSHVLNELDEADLDALVGLASRAEALVWVEPGSRDESRTLSRVRDRLLETLHPVAPCTHPSGCPMLMAEHERHWCHHFTRPPSEVHQSPHWSAFSRELQIDLGTVPYSFLVMQRQPTTMPEGFSRIIGHPRAYQGYLRVLCCHRDGLDEWSLSPGADKAIYKEARKEKLFPLIRCEVENQRIRTVERW